MTGAAVYAAEPKQQLNPIAAAQGVAACASTLDSFARHELDVVIDFAGMNTTADALRVVRPRGRIIHVVQTERSGAAGAVVAGVESRRQRPGSGRETAGHRVIVTVPGPVYGRIPSPQMQHGMGRPARPSKTPKWPARLPGLSP